MQTNDSSYSSAGCFCGRKKKKLITKGNKLGKDTCLCPTPRVSYNLVVCIDSSICGRGLGDCSLVHVWNGVTAHLPRTCFFSQPAVSFPLIVSDLCPSLTPAFCTLLPTLSCLSLLPFPVFRCLVSESHLTLMLNITESKHEIWLSNTGCLGFSELLWTARLVALYLST